MAAALFIVVSALRSGNSSRSRPYRPEGVARRIGSSKFSWLCNARGQSGSADSSYRISKIPAQKPLLAQNPHFLWVPIYWKMCLPKSASALPQKEMLLGNSFR